MADETTRIDIRARDRSAAAFRSVRGRLNRLSRQVLSARNAIVVLAGITGMGLLIKNAFASSDAMAKLSDRLQVSTQRLAALKLQAELTGTNFNRVQVAIRMSTRNLIDAAAGTGEAVEAFKTLNIEAAELARLPIDQQFLAIGERLVGVENAAQRNALAMEIFGARSSEVLNLFADGAAGLRRAQDDVDRLGVSLSRIESAQIEAANDAVTRSQLVFQGLANTIAVELSPVITALADRFTESAKASDGFRDQVVSGMENIAEAIAIASNVLQGLRFAWAGLKLGVGAAIDFMIQALADFDRQITALQNKLANSFIGKKLGIEAQEAGAAIQLMAEVSTDRLAELQEEFDAIAIEGLPAERVRAFFAEVRAQAEQSAQAVAESRAGLSDVGGTPTALAGDDSVAKLEAFFSKRLETLNAAFMTENERLIAQQNEQLSLVNAAQALEFISVQEGMRLREELELQHQAKLGDLSAQGVLQRRRFMEMNTRQQTQAVLGELLSLTGGVAASNEKMFKLNKVAGIANAIINTFQGVTKTLSAYPWPLAGAMAALHVAAGLAQVQQIRNAQFGGATSAPSVAGGGAVPVTPATQTPPTLAPGPDTAVPIVTVIIQGSVFNTDETVDTIEDRLRDRIRNNDSILIEPGSRNALLLGAA